MLAKYRSAQVRGVHAKRQKCHVTDLYKCSDCDNVSHATDLRDDCVDGDDDDDGNINCNDDQEDCDEDEGYEMLT